MSRTVVGLLAGLQNPLDLRLQLLHGERTVGRLVENIEHVELLVAQYEDVGLRLESGNL